MIREPRRGQGTERESHGVQVSPVFFVARETPAEYARDLQPGSAVCPDYRSDVFRLDAARSVDDRYPRCDTCQNSTEDRKYSAETESRGFVDVGTDRPARSRDTEQKIRVCVSFSSGRDYL